MLLFSYDSDHETMVISELINFLDKPFRDSTKADIIKRVGKF